RNYKVVFHYYKSKKEADNLSQELNEKEADSCFTIQSDFSSQESIESTVNEFYKVSKEIDVLINNASSFYSTPIQNATEAQWKDLLDTNITTPLFLIKGFQEGLKRTKGSVINISDSLAPRGIKNFSLYSSAKGALEALTKSLAKELAPEVRINAVAPGIILWPENGEIDEEQQKNILKNVDLGRAGNPMDISSAVYFLTGANYITGQTLRVDGGRS
ncbi:MAG: SDR family oxidoreductase, partial [SAR86 cluster bacterium]|nr:SDR family oxidoreductase [SAR86 cluster bacterium]